jgi:hypothetical protein
MIGYEGYRVEKVNEDGKKVYETKYRQVRYQKIQQSRSANISVQLVLISLETGKTEMTEIIRRNKQSKIEYATYGGNHKNIYPARSNGNLWKMGRRELMSSLQATRNLDSEESMIDRAVSEIADQARTRVEDEAKRLVP